MIPGFLLANVVTEGYMTDVGPFGIDVVVQTYWMLEMMGGPFVSEFGGWYKLEAKCELGIKPPQSTLASSFNFPSLP
jgi:hypothetical protein